MSNNYQRLLSFLIKYHGKQYKKQEKCTEEEKIYMNEAKKAGQEARNAFTSLVGIIEKEYDFTHERISQWQNSGTFVSYFWCQMKRSSHKNSQISLSLFAEKADDVFRFRLSIELAIDKAQKDDLETYKKLLDIPLKKELVYISGGNNEDEFRVLNERDNSIVKAMGLKKVQVSYVFKDEQYTDDDSFEKEVLKAAGLLIPYYEYLFNNKDEKVKDKTNKQDDGKEQVSFMSISTTDAIAQIKDYIVSKGFSYPDGLIENFYLCLKSKPFVILAGTSGTGKTRLVKLFSQAISAKYHLVSVRPDWSDGSDLFGHTDLNGRFIEGPVCSAFQDAIKNPDMPVILCLDEMNLARVEYYLSDFLSVIESREREQDKIVTTAIAQYQEGIPDNLYIVGTVNMDETTFPFSKKVLDRANTIEFSFVDLVPDFSDVGNSVDPLKLSNSFLCTNYLVLGQDCIAEANYVVDICNELQKINEILLEANAHVGYRVRDEIVFYLLNNKQSGNLLSHEQAMDNEIMQKILPRIQGSSNTIHDMLCELFKVCAADYTQKTGDSDSEKMKKILVDQDISCKYRKSAEKLELMVRRFEEDGFTSYWL